MNQHEPPKHIIKNIDAFVTLCQQVIADYDAGLIDLHVAADKIHSWASDNPFNNDVHPMLRKVSDMSFDIAEDYRSDQDDVADWETIKKTIENYSNGVWDSTCWILSAMYGEYSGDNLVHSYSLSVRRQDGATVIDTAAKDLRVAFSKLISHLKREQTDERYLQNLAMLAPVNVSNRTLMSITVSEYLTEPYYSTA